MTSDKIVIFIALSGRAIARHRSLMVICGYTQLHARKQNLRVGPCCILLTQEPIFSAMYRSAVSAKAVIKQRAIVHKKTVCLKNTSQFAEIVGRLNN